MEDGEGVDGAALALEDTMESLGEVHLDEFQRISNMVTGKFEGSLDDLLGTLGGDDCDGLGASTEMHGGEESRKAKEVVAVEMRDKDGAESLEFDMATTDIVLRAFGTVEKHLEAADIDNLSAAATMPCGEGSAGTEDGDEEVHIFNLFLDGPTRAGGR
jgi:hypothetical protein